MTVKISRDATLVLTPVDLCAILTAELCAYNAFADLEIIAISERDGDGCFELEMVPKAKPKLAAVTEGKA
jgi:hypothetical protein